MPAFFSSTKCIIDFVHKRSTLRPPLSLAGKYKRGWVPVETSAAADHLGSEKQHDKEVSARRFRK